MRRHRAPDPMPHAYNDAGLLTPSAVGGGGATTCWREEGEKKGGKIRGQRVLSAEWETTRVGNPYDPHIHTRHRQIKTVNSVPIGKGKMGRKTAAE